MLSCSYLSVLPDPKLFNSLSLSLSLSLYIYIYIYISAVKQLIAINHIQNKSFCLHNMCVYTVYIYYEYINAHTCM